MKFRLIFLLTASLFASCASRTYNVNIERVDIDSTIAAVRENHEKISSLRGLASVSIITGEDKVKFSQVTVIEKDNYLRLEALAIFGAVIAQIFSDGEKVYLNTRYEQLVFNNTSDFRFAVLYPDIPREIGIKELVNVLLASPQDQIWDYNHKMNFNGKTGNIMLDFDSPERLTVAIDPEKKVIDKLSFLLSSGERAVVEYSNYKRTGGVYFPFDIQLITDDYSLSITYNSKLEINPELDISIFRPDV